MENWSCLKMNKYENSLKQLTWFSRDYDNKQDDVKLCEEACTKAELFDIIIAKNIRTHLIKICDNYHTMINNLPLIDTEINKLDDKSVPNIMKHFKEKFVGKCDMSLVNKIARGQ